ncbi:MAG: hypothetical protein QG635_246, partial [Bacteroidota bacterium]|nr:hypothetical protein [Bacteroidota bacterium]
HDTIAYSSTAELFKNVNAVLIVTPTPTHYDIAIEAFRNKVHTFIEKPVTDSPEKAKQLLKMSDGLIVQVGHIERFNPALLALETYELKPLFIETHRLAQFNPRGADVSVIHDLMIHDIDIILNLVKSPVKNIIANGVGVLTGKIDIANARITFENGCVANITASRISIKQMRKMRIFQRSAYISVDFLKNSSEVIRINDAGADTGSLMSIPVEFDEKKYKITFEQPKSDDTNAMKYEQKLFFDCILNNIQPIVSLKNGIDALEVASEIMSGINDSIINMGNN